MSSNLVVSLYWYEVTFLTLSVISRGDECREGRQGRRNEKKARGAENFKKAHCNYFELKPGFIDA